MSGTLELRRLGTKSTAIAFTDNEEIRRRMSAAIGSERLRHAILTTLGIDPGQFALPAAPVERKRDIIRIPVKGPRSPVADIQDAVSAYFDMTPLHMKSARRSKAIAHPRQIAMYLASELTTFSLVQIGRMFGGRDHTTVLYAIRAVAERIDSDPDTARAVTELREAVAA